MSKKITIEIDESYGEKLNILRMFHKEIIILTWLS